MGSQSNKETQALQCALTHLWVEMLKCESEVEFQALQKKCHEITDTLKYERIHYSSLEEFKQKAQRSHGVYSSSSTPLSSMPAELRKNSNLKSISWYLERLSERVEEVNPKYSKSFREAAQLAQRAVGEVIDELNEEKLK